MDAIPFITTAQMIEIDRAMIEDYHIQLIQMMENAGRHLASLASDYFLHPNLGEKRVVVLAGSGGNGGGAMVGARWLYNWGASVQVYLTRPPEAYTSVPAQQMDILQRMGVAVSFGIGTSERRNPDLIIDGIIGYSLAGAPQGTAKTLIEWANGQSAPILSLDVPSGVDAATGQVFEPAIEATVTMTLALPKIGFREPQARQHLGELFLADIGVPPRLYQKLGITREICHFFRKQEIIRLDEELL